MFKLVGTYCKTTVSCCERVECIYESWKRTRALGQVIAIVRDELFKHSLDPGRRKNAPIGFEGTNNHCLCATPDEIPSSFERQGRQPFSPQNRINRLDVIRRVIHPHPI